MDGLKSSNGIVQPLGTASSPKHNKHLVYSHLAAIPDAMLSSTNAQADVVIKEVQTQIFPNPVSDESDRIKR